MQQLTKGVTLQGGKYKIEKILGQGGFGITYLATQDLLNREVCIKEFFFKEYCERDETTSHITLGTSSNQEFVERFMMKFIKEARMISQLDHPNIIRIHDIFKENNTAYYVMDYIEGKTLSQIVERNGRLPEWKAIGYIDNVADALKYIHDKNINHLDIKPSNIMIKNSDDTAVLIDFGLSKQYDEAGGQTSSTPLGISQGYAPMEQYIAGGVGTFSPQSDIYSLGATLYKLITGLTPPSATEILNDGFPKISIAISKSTIDTIKKAMQPKKVDRQKNIQEFRSSLNKMPLNHSKKSSKDFSNYHVRDQEDETKVINNNNTQETENSLRNKAHKLKKEIYLKHTRKAHRLTLLSALVCIPIGIIVSIYTKDPSWHEYTFMIAINVVPYIFIGLYLYARRKTIKDINSWINENKDNPICKYIIPIDFSRIRK